MVPLVAPSVPRVAAKVLKFVVPLRVKAKPVEPGVTPVSLMVGLLKLELTKLLPVPRPAAHSHVVLPSPLVPLWIAS